MNHESIDSRWPLPYRPVTFSGHTRRSRDLLGHDHRFVSDWYVEIGFSKASPTPLTRSRPGEVYPWSRQLHPSPRPASVVSALLSSAELACPLGSHGFDCFVLIRDLLTSYGRWWSTGTGCRTP